MARTGRELAIVHGPQLTRQRLLGEGKAELLPEPRDQVDQTPAHHTVDRRNGPLLDDGLQGRAMRVGEFRGLAGRLAVDQARGPMGVELHHPVPHDLHRDPADPGRRGAGRPVIDRGQGQKAPRLRAVLGRAGDRAQRLGIKVCPERNRHGEPPSFATLNQTCLKPTRPNRVTPSGTWYEAFRAYVEQVLAPELEPGDAVVMDNLSPHKVAGVQEAIRAAGGSVLYLPSYSPDFNPIEQLFAKFKALLRKAAARTQNALWETIGTLLDDFAPAECQNDIINSGYEFV